jgi:hypothetical protein
VRASHNTEHRERGIFRPVGSESSIWNTSASDRQVGNALEVAITHVFVNPDDWEGLDEVARNEYMSSAEVQGIHFRVAYERTTNPNQIVTVSDDDFAALDAPYYFGPTGCGRREWEHLLRRALDMDDPCFEGRP